jgi:hypothetical protein
MNCEYLLSLAVLKTKSVLYLVYWKGRAELTTCRIAQTLIYSFAPHTLLSTVLDTIAQNVPYRNCMYVYIYPSTIQHNGSSMIFLSLFCISTHATSHARFFVMVAIKTRNRLLSLFAFLLFLKFLPF